MYRINGLATLALVTVISLTLLLASVSASSDSVRFIDSYWGSSLKKVEVGPGDLYIPLTVVLGNDFKSDVITHIRGELKLEDGFSSTNPDEPNVARAFYPARVAPGESFELTFIVNLDGIQKVGVYKATLDLYYVVIGDTARKQSFVVPLYVSGKPHIRIFIANDSIPSGTSSDLRFSIRNVGTAPASGVKLSLSSTAPNLLTFIGGDEYEIGTLKAGEEVIIQPTVFAAPLKSDTPISLKMMLSYVNTVGDVVIVERLAGLKLTRTGLADIDLRVWADKVELEPGMEHIVRIHIINVGAATAKDVRLTFEQSPNVPVAPLGEGSSLYIEEIAPGKEVILEVAMKAAKGISGGVFQLPISLMYRDELGNAGTSISYLTVSVGESKPEAPEIVLESKGSITAGRAETLEVNVKNLVGEAIDDLVLTFKSRDPAVKLLGTNTWALGSMEKDERKTIRLELYAAPSVAGSAIALDVETKYVVRNTGEVKNERVELGLLTLGLVKITVYDLEIRKIGESVNLVGSILNEGNVPALFTTIAFESDQPSPITASKPIYIGDLNPNAPLPFTIQLEGLVEGTGSLKGKIIVLYKDDFRNEYKSVNEINVHYELVPEVRGEAEGFNISRIAFPLLVIALIVVVLGVVFVRRRKAGNEGG